MEVQFPEGTKKYVVLDGEQAGTVYEELVKEDFYPDPQPNTKPLFFEIMNALQKAAIDNQRFLNTQKRFVQAVYPDTFPRNRNDGSLDFKTFNRFTNDKQERILKNLTSFPRLHDNSLDLTGFDQLPKEKRTELVATIGATGSIEDITILRNFLQSRAESAKQEEHQADIQLRELHSQRASILSEKKRLERKQREILESTTCGGGVQPYQCKKKRSGCTIM